MDVIKFLEIIYILIAQVEPETNAYKYLEKAMQGLRADIKKKNLVEFDKKNKEKKEKTKMGFGELEHCLNDLKELFDRKSRVFEYLENANRELWINATDKNLESWANFLLSITRADLKKYDFLKTFNFDAYLRDAKEIREHKILENQTTK